MPRSRNNYGDNDDNNDNKTSFISKKVVTGLTLGTIVGVTALAASRYKVCQPQQMLV